MHVISDTRVCYDRNDSTRNIKFKGCTVVDGRFEDCVFIDCLFQSGSVMRSDFTKCSIKSGRFKESYFDDCRILGGRYVDSRISGEASRTCLINFSEFEKCVLVHCRPEVSKLQFCRLEQSRIRLCDVMLCYIVDCHINRCNLYENSYSLGDVTNTLYYLAAKAGVTFFRDRAGELWGTVQRSTYAGGKGQFTPGFVESEGYFEIEDCVGDDACGVGKHGGTNASYYHSNTHKGKELWAMTFKMKDLVACDGVKVKVRAGYMHRVGKLPWVGEK